MERSRLLSQARTRRKLRSNGGEDDVGGVALAAHEVAMAEVLISFMWPMTALMAECGAGRA
jgi:hypothetical protein